MRTSGWFWPWAALSCYAGCAAISCNGDDADQRVHASPASAERSASASRTTRDAGNSRPEDDASVDAGAPDEPRTQTAEWQDVFAILHAHCVPCHASTSSHPDGSGRLDMSSQAVAYMQLVGVDAQGSACAGHGEVRVRVGDPKRSLLVRKLQNASGLCGAPMPKPNDARHFLPIPADEISAISAWIAGGAQRD